MLILHNMHNYASLWYWHTRVSVSYTDTEQLRKMYGTTSYDGGHFKL
jgi:hypothetical protein